MMADNMEDILEAKRYTEGLDRRCDDVGYAGEQRRVLVVEGKE